VNFETITHNMEKTSLLIPRCEVFWGDVKISPNTSQTDPTVLVSDVNVSLQESGQTPSASMRWDPTGLGFSIYEELLNTSLSDTITIRFFYVGGKSITFSFVWSGHTESYGNDMSLEVKLASEVDGLVNANIKSTAKVEDKGMLLPDVISRQSTSYGVEGIAKVELSPQAELNLTGSKAPKITQNYSEGTTWAETIRSTAEETGHLVSFLGVRDPSDPEFSPYKAVVFGPYKTDKTPVEEASPTSDYPDPKKRYGYFLGPGIIDTLQKTSEWQQPQKTQTPVDNSQQKQPSRKSNPYAEESAQPSPTRPQDAQQKARENAAKAPGASGTGKRGRAGSRIKNNQTGEDNKKALQEERASKLSATVFMCPVLTGIKPNDVVFVPSYKGDFMEDWIVTSVEYSQTDGGVELSIQASREYGLGNFMNRDLAEPWRIKAFQKGLVGPSASLDNWLAYAWNIPIEPFPLPEGVQAAAQAVTGGPGTPKQRALLDVLAYAEGTDRNQTGEGYGTIYGGKVVPELERGDLTVRQVYDMMNSGTLNGRSVGYSPGSSATGRYQFMPGTLSDLVKGGSTTWDAKFTPELQDSLALSRMSGFRGVTASLLESEGFSRNVSNKLAPEWASVPTYSGRSFYGQPVKAYSDLQRVFSSSLARNSSASSTPSLPPAVTTTPTVPAPVSSPAPTVPAPQTTTSLNPTPVSPSSTTFTEFIFEGRPATKVNNPAFVNYLKSIQLPTRGDNEALLTPDITRYLFEGWRKLQD
jgi:muramidase (phage lysozyme)